MRENPLMERPVESYPFRPWVRSTCRKAMLWGVGVVGVLGLVTWLLKAPGSAPLGRAFGVLVFYGLLFWLTLAKIWWTAGRPAIVLDDESVGYQPLHTFRPRRVRFDSILSCSPRQSTQSLRVVYLKKAEVARELFLNLGVINGRNEFLDTLGERLESEGLEAEDGKRNSWRRPGWTGGDPVEM